METIAKIHADMERCENDMASIAIDVDGKVKDQMMIMLQLVRVLAQRLNTPPQHYLAMMLASIDDAAAAERGHIEVDRNAVEIAKGGTT